MSSIPQTVYNNRFTSMNKLSLWQLVEDGSEDGGKPQYARLEFGFRDGNPRFVVYTGLKGSAGIITFPCDIPHMVHILSMMKDVANNDGECKYHVTSETFVKDDNGKATKELKVQSSLYIGKTSKDNGSLVYMTVTAKDKQKIVFTIKPSKFHKFYRNNELITDAEYSKKVTLGTVDLILNLIALAINQHTIETYTHYKTDGFIDTNKKPMGEIFKGID